MQTLLLTSAPPSHHCYWLQCCLLQISDTTEFNLAFLWLRDNYTIPLMLMSKWCLKGLYRETHPMFQCLAKGMDTVLLNTNYGGRIFSGNSNLYFISLLSLPILGHNYYLPRHSCISSSHPSVYPFSPSYSYPLFFLVLTLIEPSATHLRYL